MSKQLVLKMVEGKLVTPIEGAREINVKEDVIAIIKKPWKKFNDWLDQNIFYQEDVLIVDVEKEKLVVDVKGDKLVVDVEKEKLVVDVEKEKLIVEDEEEILTVDSEENRVITSDEENGLIFDIDDDDLFLSEENIRDTLSLTPINNNENCYEEGMSEGGSIDDDFEEIVLGHLQILENMKKEKIDLLNNCSDFEEKTQLKNELYQIGKEIRIIKRLEELNDVKNEDCDYQLELEKLKKQRSDLIFANQNKYQNLEAVIKIDEQIEDIRLKEEKQRLVEDLEDTYRSKGKGSRII